MKKKFFNIFFSFIFLFVCFSAEAQKNSIPPKFPSKYQGFLADHMDSFIPPSSSSYPSDSLNLKIGIGGESLGFVASSEIMDRLQSKFKESHDPSFIPKEFVSNGRLYPIPFLDQVSLGNFFVQMQTHHHTQDLPFLQSHTHSSFFEILKFRFQSQSSKDPVFVKNFSSRVIYVFMDRDREYVQPIAFVRYEATLTQHQGDRVIEVPVKEIWTLFITGDDHSPYVKWILAGVTPI